MFNGANSTEDSDDTEAMAQHATETEREEWYTTQKYHGGKQKQSAERRSYHDLTCECCYKVEQLALHDLERSRRRKIKSQVQHCPSCHCTPDQLKRSMERTNYSNNVEAVLKEYEHFLSRPMNQMIKKPQNSPVSSRRCGCGYATPNARHHSRKRQTSSYRCQRCSTGEDQMFSATMKNVDSNVNDSGKVNREYAQSTKNIHARNDRWRHCQIKGESSGSSDVDSELSDKCVQQQKKQSSRADSWMSRQHHEKAGKTDASRKNDLGDDKDCDLGRHMVKLRFDLPESEDLKEIDLKSIEERREKQAKGKSNGLSNKTSAMKPKQEALSINVDDYLKGGDARKETEDQSEYKLRKRSTIRQGELIVKDEEEEIPFRKSVYAGGDLDLHATQSCILGLIDRALNSKFATSSDQQKNVDSNRGLTLREICIEITRVLQGNSCCQSLTEDLLSHRESSADYIKLLKKLRWEHMNHIQNEFRKLCDLQQFLDTCSPRSSLPTFQSHPVAVEQQSEEQQQQQQHEEKQNLGTIS